MTKEEFFEFIGEDMMKKIILIGLNEDGRRVGQSHPKARLTDDEVEKMRVLREGLRVPYHRLAELFEVSVFTVVKICQYARRNQVVFREKEVNLNA